MEGAQEMINYLIALLLTIALFLALLFFLYYTKDLSKKKKTMKNDNKIPKP